MPEGAPSRAVTRSERWVGISGIAGLVGVLVFWATQAGLHALRTDLSVVNDYVSDYANGRWGLLFTVGILVHGIGNLAIAAGLARALAPARAPRVTRAARCARAGVLLFTLAALGLLVAGVFPTDPADAPQTATGLVHRSAAFGSFASELIALALLAVAFGADAAWRRYVPLSVAITATAGLTLGWLLVAIGSELPPGLPERAALLSFALWEFATAVLLTRSLSSRGAGRQDHQPAVARGPGKPRGI